MISWRSFSGNKGKPSEKNLYHDGNRVVEWLNEQGINKNDIILYGESLGTGVATHLSQNKNFAGVILESPFTSMVDAGKHYYFYLKVLPTLFFYHLKVWQLVVAYLHN